MEQYDKLKGLWSALNERNFEKILQYKEHLQTSKNYTKLISAIRKNEKKFTGTYCKQGDTEITISRYISTLGPIIPKSGNSKSGNLKKSNAQEIWS